MLENLGDVNFTYIHPKNTHKSISLVSVLQSHSEGTPLGGSIDPVIPGKAGLRISGKVASVWMLSSVRGGGVGGWGAPL